MKKWLWLVGLGVVSSLSALGVAWPRVATPAAGKTRDDRSVNVDVSALESRISQLEAEGTRAGLLHLVNAQTRDSPESPTTAAKLPADDDGVSGGDEGVYKQERTVQAHADTYATTLAKEPVDQAWSGSATSMIRDHYRGEGFAEVRISSACKSTLCKIDFEGSDLGKTEEAMRAMINNPPWNAAGMYHVDKTTGKGYAFISRENFELPQVAPSNLADD
jgi:hypothetical protein